MIHIYGIKNCSSMKKAFDWLGAHELEYEFHDYKKEPISPEAIYVWVQALGLDTVLNKRGTTYRKLTDEQKQDCIDTAKACALMSENLSMIKRPIVVFGEASAPEYMAGFDADKFEERLG